MLQEHFNQETAGNAEPSVAADLPRGETPIEQRALACIAPADLVEAAPDAMIMVDRMGRIVLTNRQTEVLFGYRREELLGQSIGVLIPEQFRVAHVQHCAGYFQHPSVRPMGSGTCPTARRKDGSEFPIDISLSPVETAAGVMVISAIRDVTERIRMEEERAQLLAREQAARTEAEAGRRRLLTLLEQTPEGVLIAEAPDGRFSLWNRAAQRLCGHALSGASIALLRSIPFQRPDGQPYGFEDLPLVRALHTGEPVLGAELALPGVEGSRRVLLVNAAPIRDEDGNISAAVAVIQDITQRKTLEQLKDEFVSLAAHELRSPLTIILGNCQMVARRLQHLTDQPGRRRTYPVGDIAAMVRSLEDVRSGAEDMARSVNELLDLSRIETGRLTLNPEPVDLAALLPRVIAQQQALHADHPIALEGVAGSVWGTWDRGRLEEVFANLLDNAAKYSAAGRPITVCLNLDAGPGGVAAHVTVQDQGIGIPAVDLPHLFERYYRAGNVGRARTGLGLGLYLASQIVHLHCGHIWAESVAGQGSTFHVTLPLEGPARRS